MTMVELTESAKKCLDQYLDRVRLYLRGCKSVDAAEVEANIREHIESEFASATAAVSYEQLDAVLVRLGSPQQWVPEDELPSWRKVLYRLRTGPEDWRLAYLTLGLFVLGFVVLPSILVMLPASFLVARAAVSLSDGKIPKPQKWLIYPSLLAVYIPAAIILMLWPVFLIDGIGDYLCHAYRGSDTPLADDTHCWVIAWIVVIAITGLWWILLAILQLISPGLMGRLAAPFASRFSRRTAVIQLLVGLGLCVLPFIGSMYYFRYVI